MTEQEINNKAFEAYPDTITPFPQPIVFQQRERDGYIKAMKEILTPENMWKFYEIGCQVKEELCGKETSLKYFGNKMLEKFKL